MSTSRRTFLLSLSLALLSSGLFVQNASAADAKIRVACVGDSITFGSGVQDRANNSYPVQLGKML